MISIGHIIQPFTPGDGSDLEIAQPITFETMRIARNFADKDIETMLYSAQYPEDIQSIPDFFTRTADLKGSVLDKAVMSMKLKLPMIRDILDRLYETSDAEYFIYTNVDIALLPCFYNTVSKIISQGYDAFVINRRTISDKYSDIEDIPLMFSETGTSHKGYDCFVFKREVYPEFELGNICIGAAWVGRALLANLVLHSKKFKEFRELHITFHIGNSSIWREQRFNEFADFNRREYLKIFHMLEKKTGKLEPGIRSYLTDTGNNRLIPDFDNSSITGEK